MSARRQDPVVRPAAPVDLDVVEFAPDGRGALRLVATSLPTAEATSGWTAVLGPHLARPVTAVADGSLTYLRFGPQFAAVLRRWPGTAAAPGRVQGFVGSADDLTPTIAVGLTRRSAWHAGSNGTVGSTIPLPADLAPDARTSAELRRIALDHDEQLARVLAWTLQAPGRPLAVVGCPPAGRAGLLWGLVQIAAPLSGDRTWTFTTDDIAPDSAGDPDLPEIVFLAARPSDAVPTRTIVDLTQDQGASPGNEYAANALVYRYEFGVDPDAAAPGAGAAAAVLPNPVAPPAAAVPPAAVGFAPAPTAATDDAVRAPAPVNGGAAAPRPGPAVHPTHVGPPPGAAMSTVDDDPGLLGRLRDRVALPASPEHRRLLLIALVLVAVALSFLAGLAVGSFALLVVPLRVPS